ncbi:MAG: hypothetical protein M1832_005247 [Thelocarpon impressellum]|nr:MAG: hypothetical protein M1832_005247 [Thelocarpon impressellum]
MPEATDKPQQTPTPQGSPEPASIAAGTGEASPITANGIEGDDDAGEEDAAQASPEGPGSSGSVQSGMTVNTIDTAILARPRSASDETPQSVIHAPRGFKEFEPREGQRKSSPPLDHRKTPPPSQRSDFAVRPSTLQVDHAVTDKALSNSPVSPPPISTTVASAKFSMEGATPRAQTRQEVDALAQEREKGRRERSTSLEDIPEAQGHDGDAEEEPQVQESVEAVPRPLAAMPRVDEEINALKTALDECWTLCNTLAGLSSIHRQRIFEFAGTGDMQEQAWKSCWKLCQKLYDSRDDDHDRHVRPTLNLCREFCQSLFEVRQRDSEVADSVLRVSFELNNHLYNTHDRNLPEAFRERTLDFYITLCHRLMKQRSGMAEETDSLLRACWSLAEMLFSLRQNKREGKSADEELLGSAVQACWELCDLFREGWTQVRPDRGTPRPSQTTFSQAFTQMKQPDLGTVHERHTEPETPTTIFEDTATSPDGDEIEAPPNILVLGTDNAGRSSQRWSSNASALSGYSQESTETSTTATTAVTGEDPNLTRLKVLIVKAAMNCGFQRSAGQTLNTFVKSLPTNSFGTLDWQMELLEDYRQMVLTDPTFRAPLNLPPRTASAAEVARSVQWMIRRGQYTFLRDLFRHVFGFRADEADRRGHVVIQT